MVIVASFCDLFFVEDYLILPVPFRGQRRVMDLLIRGGLRIPRDGLRLVGRGDGSWRGLRLGLWIGHSDLRE
jgi:hypothetical protein